MEVIRSQVAPLLVDHVDTDQIIPARFLKTVTREGLGAQLFADWREPPNARFDPGARRGASILLSGANFGCGSSREHAAWALTGAGFRAVVAQSFADIFQANALRNGLLPVAPQAGAYERLVGHLSNDPSIELEIDLDAQHIRLGDEAFSFDVDPFAKHCLMNGLDPLRYVLERSADIKRYEARHG